MHKFGSLNSRIRQLSYKTGKSETVATLPVRHRAGALPIREPPRSEFGMGIDDRAGTSPQRTSPLKKTYAAKLQERSRVSLGCSSNARR
jgi:hypothetical protein